MGKFCRKCGKSLPSGAQVCEGCGTRVVTKMSDAPKIQPVLSTRRSDASLGGSREDRSAQARSLRDEWFAPIAVFLAITILGSVVLTRYANMRYPRLYPRTGDYAGGSVIMDERETTPYSPQIGYTENEIKSASKDECSITQDNPSVTVGEVGVSLPYFLIDEGETVTVAEIPAKSDAEGNEIYAYDISLGSGIHQLGACAEVTIPRKAGTGEIGRVMYYNEATDEWTPVCYDISDDGKSYIIQTTHFSIFGEYLEKLSDIYGSNEEDLAGELFYKVLENGKGLHQERVDINENVLMDMVKKSVSSDEVVKIQYDPYSQTTIPEDTAITMWMNLFNRFGLGYGMTVINTVTKLIENTKFTNGCGYAGAALTFLRMGYQYINGGKFSEVVWENKGDILGTVTSFFAINATVAGASSAATAFGWAGLIIFIGAELQNADEEKQKFSKRCLPENIYEAVAAYYNNKNATYRGKSLTGYYQSNELLNQWTWDDSSLILVLRDITNDNLNNPEKIYDELNALFDAYSSPFFALSTDEQYNYVEKLYYDENERNKFLDSPYVSNLKDDEIENEALSSYYFGISKNQIASFMDEAHVSMYRARTRNLAVSEGKDIFMSYMEGYYSRSVEELKKSLRNETLELMNKNVVLSAVDTSKDVRTFDESPYSGVEYYEKIGKGEIFLREVSPYGFVGAQKNLYKKDEIPMYFTDVKAPLFYPSNKEALCAHYGIDDYYGESTFVPHANVDADTDVSEIFSCRFYDYLAVGMPHTIYFRGDAYNPPIPNAEAIMDEGSIEKMFRLGGTVVLQSNELDGFIPIDTEVYATEYRNNSTKMCQNMIENRGIAPKVDFTLDRNGNWTVFIGKLQYYDGHAVEVEDLVVRGTASAETTEYDIEEIFSVEEFGIDGKQRLGSRVKGVDNSISYREYYVDSETGKDAIFEKVGTCDVSSDETFFRAVPDFSVQDKTKINFDLCLTEPCTNTKYIDSEPVETFDDIDIIIVSFSVELDTPLSQFRWISAK